jgi:endonuclease/exonuclease/phosphatase family metal-dependent hydrolase
VLVDVYDVHLDAGPGAGDRKARALQVDQLVEAIEKTSAGRALVLGGDFNLTSAELPAFKKRMAALGITDACDEARCAQPWRIDRVLLRGNPAVSLKTKTWRLAAGFRDGSGRALSDHEPVVVTVGWATK